MNVNDKAAIVTGAASGIGRSICLALADQGIPYILGFDLDQAGLEETGKQIGRLCLGRHSTFFRQFQGDVTSDADRQRAFDLCEQDFGRPARLCVSCAGITRDGPSLCFVKADGNKKAYYKSAPIEDFRLVIEIHLIAGYALMMEMAVRVANQILAEERESQDGLDDDESAVGILIGSVAAKGNPCQRGYPAAKSGLEATSAMLSREWLKTQRMRVITVIPGFVETPMTDAMKPEVLAQQISQSALPRRIPARAIAHGVLFAIGNEALTDSLPISGGWQPRSLEPRAKKTVQPSGASTLVGVA